MSPRYERTDDRLTVAWPGARWLSNGVGGGYRAAAAAHNLTVPEGFDRTDLEAYVAERLGDRPPGPTLLTGVSQRHARGARRGPVAVVATAGLSNPAVLPEDGDGHHDVEAQHDVDAHDDGEARNDGGARKDGEARDDGGARGTVASGGPGPGTVNLLVTADRALEDGALAGLLATATEAKAATLLDVAGVPGTTTDAVVVGCDPDGDAAAFAGSATPVGAAARACVRKAVRASLASRYGDDGPPEPVDAEHGVVTDTGVGTFVPGAE